jgi:pimeloyl-ACP methyl ester carboxylesterase
MPYANNNGVKIYYEVEGEEPPLVLAHPLIEDMNIWRRRGYVDVLKSDYQLVLFDSSGRGRSDRPPEASAYDISVMSQDVLAVLYSLRLDRTHYFGFSSGARIGFWLATHHAERFTSFILGGQSPYRYAEITFKLVQEAIETYKLRLIDPEAALQRRQDWFGGNRPLTDREKSTFLAEDAQTLALLYSSYLDWPTLTDQDLSRISLPCLILCGELDEGGHFPGARESAHCIPNARFISFPSIGHYLSELFLPPIKEFLAEMSKK